MRFVMMIMGNDEPKPGQPASPWPLPSEHDALHARMARDGVPMNGEELQRGHTARTVRTRNGKQVITDGPFSETAEHLGGFYILDLPDMDAALEYAKMLSGTVEIRPVVDHGGQG
jgi:hypothetical protein